MSIYPLQNVLLLQIKNIPYILFITFNINCNLSSKIYKKLFIISEYIYLVIAKNIIDSQIKSLS